MSTALACVRVGEASLRAGKVCLGTSEVNVAGNECSLGFRSLRTSAKKNAWQHSGAAIIKKRFVPKKFCQCTCSYEGEVVKFVLEQPSSMGVGHELAHSCTCYSSSVDS